MAKQTFTTGSVLTATQMNDLQTNDFNWTVNQKTASYVLVASDKGTRIEMNSGSATTVTVNTGLFAAGDTLFIQNIGAGVCTVTAGTATVQRASNASLALAQYQGGYLYFISASNAVFFADAGFTSPLTTKGDLFTWDTGNARLPVGTNGQVLTAQSGQATGLQWATIGSTKNFSLLGTGSLSSGSTVTVSGISGQDQIYVGINGASSTGTSAAIRITFNSDTSANYDIFSGAYTSSSTYSANNLDANGSTGFGSIAIGLMSNNAGSTVSGSLFLSGANTAGKKIFMFGGAGSPSSGNGHLGYWGGGVWNNTSTVSSVSVTCSTGTFDAGVFYVYGSA